MEYAIELSPLCHCEGGLPTVAIQFDCTVDCRGRSGSLAMTNKGCLLAEVAKDYLRTIGSAQIAQEK